MERRAIVVRGIVQGVGFRPFIYLLATRLELAGFVKNRAGDVFIEAEGPASALDEFLARVREDAPPLARIESLSWQGTPTRGEAVFSIVASQAKAPAAVFVSPDIATCLDCLRELFDSTDRRYRYPFLNCTNCGPRLTIIQGAPFDRSRTTMAGFNLCDACRREFEDPLNRRFHAQPICCPACGPRLQFVEPGSGQEQWGDPLDRFVRALRQRRIGALKGLGGYHLVCDARSNSAVSELRDRKHREARPLAVMVKDVETARNICTVGAAEGKLLESRARPIVLLRKKNVDIVAEAVAPANPYLGVLLPYTGLHHLLTNELPEMPLVMTSGNRSDEPIAIDDADALSRLAGIADVFLLHDRPIRVRCDDSVVRVIAEEALPVRRSRGYAPAPVSLPFACPSPILALGGQLKATFALGRDRQAFLSHHLGDLDHYKAYQAFVNDIQLYESLFALEPEIVVHDLHPDYASTRYAREREGGNAGRRAVKCLAVQHHQAHVASCMAENGLTDPVIGVALDGSGYGTDGAIWGGEFFVGTYRNFRRVAHLRYVGMPGGEAAIREPWRMAFSHALDAGRASLFLKNRIPDRALRTVGAMLEKRFQCPATSSAGRLFDAIASLAGIRDRVAFEGQAAVELEARAVEAKENEGSYPFVLVGELEAENESACLIIDTRPLIRSVMDEVERNRPPERIARRFHTTMVEIIVETCARIREEFGIEAVTLSGGVFMNVLLSSEASQRLQGAGFRVFHNRKVPANDAGLSLGQLAIAAQHEFA